MFFIGISADSDLSQIIEAQKVNDHDELEYLEPMVYSYDYQVSY